MNFIAAIDDISTGTQTSFGWSYVLIDESLEAEFEEKTRALLKGNALPKFHGKEYKKRFKQSYIDFLKIIKEYAVNSDQSLLACVLLSQGWKENFVGFAERLGENPLKMNGINAVEVINPIKALTPSLFSMQNLTKEMGGENSIKIKVDDHDNTRGFNQVITKVKGFPFTGDKLLTMIYNGYRKQQFPQSPSLADSCIQVVKDEDSMLVQAVDIVANFSTAYIYGKLGKTSKTIKDKMEIFNEVFGEEFGSQNFFEGVELVHESDLKLKFEGQQTLKFGRYGSS